MDNVNVRTPPQNRSIHDAPVARLDFVDTRSDQKTRGKSGLWEALATPAFHCFKSSDMSQRVLRFGITRYSRLDGALVRSKDINYWCEQRG